MADPLKDNRETYNQKIAGSNKGGETAAIIYTLIEYLALVSSPLI